MLQKDVMKRVLAMLLMLVWSSWCLGAESGHEAAPHAPEAHHAESNPAVAHQPAWAGTMVAVIGMMFAAALVAGLLVRPAPPEELDAGAHDDHHGSSHDAHGHAGHH